MKRLLKAIIVVVSISFVLLIAGLGYFAWYVSSPSGRAQDVLEQRTELKETGRTETTFGTQGIWRYRMTVTVATPEGDKSFSSVREVHAVGAKIKLPNAGGHARVAKGEAVVIDLGERGKAFALMRSIAGRVDYAYDVVFRAFPTDKGGLTPEGVRHYSQMKSSDAVELDISNYPQFVYFRDMGDPKTVENLIEVESCPNAENPIYKLCIKHDRFAEIFGSGVKVKSVRIEMTDDPANTGIIGEYIPSYKKNYEEFMVWFRSLPYGDIRKIGPDAFGSWGEKQ